MSLRRPDWTPEYAESLSAKNRAAHSRTDAVGSTGCKATVETTVLSPAQVRQAPLLAEMVERAPVPREGWPVFEAMLRTNNLPAPCYEFRFNAERKWRFDMAFPQHRIAIEVDGGIWRSDRGAHGRPQNILRDMEKMNAAQIAGWRVLRYTPDNLATAIDDMKSMLNA